MPKLPFAFSISILMLISGILFNSCERDNSGTGNNFPANQVKSLFIDESGVVWAGTDMGIISYREEKWKTYKDIKKLPSGEVSDIAFQLTDYGSEMWLATPNGAGVANYELDAITSATSYTKGPSEILDNRITAVLVDAQESRWFATPGGLSIFRGSTWYSETDWDELIANPVISLGAQSDGWVFAGTNGLGVARFRYDEDIDGISGASYYNSEWSDLPSDTVLCIYVDKNNHQWFGTTHGVAFHSSWEAKIEWKLYTVADGLIRNRVQAIAEDDNNVMWFGTSNGVSSFDGENWKNYTVNDGLINSGVNDIAIDTTGTVWFATDGGISTYNGSAWKNFSR